MSAVSPLRFFSAPVAAILLLLALSACQMASSELEGMSPDEAAATLSEEQAFGASGDVPSEFSDATGEMGL